MAAKYWIKLYHEILDDPKMGRLPDALFRRVIELFLLAGDCDRAGALPPLADTAWRLHADEGALLTQLETLEGLGILARDQEGGWQVAHFGERQAAAPGAERARRSRETAREGRERDAPGDDTCNAAVTKRYTDTDTEAETESEQMADADADADDDGGGGVPDNDLARKFTAYTGIPLFAGDEGKWRRALARMRQAGVDADDLEQAIDECRSKGLTIASLASVATPAIIAMSRRRAGRPEEDYRRYLKGEYGEVGR